MAGTSEKIMLWVLACIVLLFPDPATCMGSDLFNVTSVADIDFSQYNNTKFCTPDFTKGVPWSYDSGNSIWYSYLPYQKGQWWNMEKYCREVELGRSSMVTIATEKEQKFIAKLILSSDQYFWMGALRAAGKLYWYKNIKGVITLQPLTYSHWASGQPDKTGDCEVILATDATWGEWNCRTNSFPAVCELRC